jgi:hypothetical protein
MVHRGILKYIKSDDRIVKEDQEVCLDREMHGGILAAQVYVDKNTDTKGP